MPAFWLGIVLMIIFAVNLKWLPTSGRAAYGIVPEKVTGLYLLDALVTGNWASLKGCLRHLILPSIALGAAPAAVITRVVRSSMLEVLRKDYVTFARAKGVPEFSVILRHAFRNALIPAVTVTGLEVGSLLGGNMIVETIFGWPGMGRLVVVDESSAEDYTLVQAAVMVYALTFVMVNLVADALYTYLNPKIGFRPGGGLDVDQGIQQQRREIVINTRSELVKLKINTLLANLSSVVSKLRRKPMAMLGFGVGRIVCGLCDLSSSHNFLSP
jgi:peptide/nickel transport system permease protein